jgi:hypothetical protein
MPCSRQLCHRHTTLSLAQNRKDLRLAIPRQLHKNLLVQNAEKILLINPLNYRGGLPEHRGHDLQISKHKKKPLLSIGIIFIRIFFLKFILDFLLPSVPLICVHLKPRGTTMSAAAKPQTVMPPTSAPRSALKSRGSSHVSRLAPRPQLKVIRR